MTFARCCAFGAVLTIASLALAQTSGSEPPKPRPTPSSYVALGVSGTQAIVSSAWYLDLNTMKVVVCKISTGGPPSCEYTSMPK
jgi:hypothetical protein